MLSHAFLFTNLRKRRLLLRKQPTASWTEEESPPLSSVSDANLGKAKLACRSKLEEAKKPRGKADAPLCVEPWKVVLST